MFLSGRLGSAKLIVGLDELRVLVFFNLSDYMILKNIYKTIIQEKITLMFKTCFESIVLYCQSIYAVVVLKVRKIFKSMLYSYLLLYKCS